MSDIGSLAGEIRITPNVTATDAEVPGATSNAKDFMTIVKKFTFGTGANQINKRYENIDAALTNAAPVTDLLEDGSLKNVYGGDFDPNALKAVIIAHDADSLSSGVSLSGTWLANIGLAFPALVPGEAIVLLYPALGKPVIAADSIIFSNDDAGNVAKMRWMYLGDDL